MIVRTIVDIDGEMTPVITSFYREDDDTVSVTFHLEAIRGLSDEHVDELTSVLLTMGEGIESMVSQG